MTTSILNLDNVDENTLRLSASMFTNHHTNKPFEEHLEYKNFKLNDPRYLDALATLHNTKAFMYIVQKFAMYYMDATDEISDKFIKYSENGNTKNIKLLKPSVIDIYFGLQTKFPEAFLSPPVYCHFPRTIRYGLAMSYYIKHGKFMDDTSLYIALTEDNKTAKVLEAILAKHKVHTDFYQKLYSLVYTDDISSVPYNYMSKIMEHINPKTFTMNQKVQFLRNIYKFSLNEETEESKLEEYIMHMNSYCNKIPEWPTIKKQILILNSLTGTTFENKEIVLSLLTQKNESVILPQITFNN